MTYLCVPIFVQDAAQARRDIAAAVEACADMVELRVDRMKELSTLDAVLPECPLPAIVTCRAASEGGHSRLSDADRLIVLAMAVDDGAKFIDIELATILAESEKLADLMSEFPLEQPPKLIVSYHDFTSRPMRLYHTLSQMHATPASINKIVWMARSVRDNIEAFEILQEKSRPTIAICMGEAGLICRILAKKFGAFLTFAALNADAGTAPGQPTITDLRGLYRWNKISPQTKVFGVVGNPVGHSMSPAIHNAAFDATGFDGVYVPFLVQSTFESFKAFMENFAWFAALHLGGVSVTIPHKENALRYLLQKDFEVEELATRIGAVNTIIISREGDRVQMRGLNTDYAAILDSITSRLNIPREDLQKFHVAVLGAGGAARAAVAGLAHYSARITIYNRTLDRAASLASEFASDRSEINALPLRDLHLATCDIYINTTSVGMHPNIDQSPFGENAPKLTGQTVVFDTVYNPLRTSLIEQATEQGAMTIEGSEMFIRQAAAQFEVWTRTSAPTAVMREALIARLTAARSSPLPESH